MFGWLKNPRKMAERQLRKHWDGRLPVTEAVFGDILLRHVSDLEPGVHGRLIKGEGGNSLIMVSTQLSEVGQRCAAAFLLGMALRGRRTAVYGERDLMVDDYSVDELRWGHQFLCALLVPEGELFRLLTEDRGECQDVPGLANRFGVAPVVVQRQIAGY